MTQELKSDELEFLKKREKNLRWNFIGYICIGIFVTISIMGLLMRLLGDIRDGLWIAFLFGSFASHLLSILRDNAKYLQIINKLKGNAPA